MKSVQFKRKNSMLRVMPEDKIVRKINWDKTIYLFLLFIGGLLFLRFVFYRTLYVEAEGQVLFQNVNIRLTDDARILRFHKKEGDVVKIGDSLFTYFKDLNNQGDPGYSASVEIKRESADWIQKERFNINKSIMLNNLEIIEQKELLESYKKGLNTYRNEVMLDVVPKIKLESIENEMIKLRSNIQKLSSTNAELKRYLGTLTPNYFNSKYRSIPPGSKNQDTLVKVFYSPIEGTVTRTYLQPYETALKTDNILSIHKGENIYIKAFFEQEDLKSIHDSDQVTITFPDGSKSVGVIKRFYYATYQLPEEFQKKYEPVTRSLAADVVPADTSELRKWKAYYKLSVGIKKLKYRL